MAGAVTVQTVPKDDMLSVKKVRLVCRGDSSNGTVPNTVIPGAYLKDYHLYKVDIIPSTPAPDEFGVEILNNDGVDMLGGTGATAGHATNKVQIPCMIGSSYAPVPTDGKDMTLQISNQATANALWTINLYFTKG